MSIRLVDENATTKVDIDGTIFHVRHLSWSGREKFAHEMGELIAEEGLPALVKLLSKYVVKVEGMGDVSIEEILDRGIDEKGRDITDLLIPRIMHPLSERESKNSASSPGSSSTNSAGKSTAKDATPNDGDA